MQGIADILHAKDFDEPREAAAIKAYVQDHYNRKVRVVVEPKVLIVSAESSALIGSLRLNLPALQKASGSEKRIILRTA